ncbi:MAG: thiamine pyrophosphate-dependent enzyme, partial [Candidatus Promineifilaceae bacterium]
AGSAPLVAVLGDITFYHDMNGLLHVTQRRGGTEAQPDIRNPKSEIAPVTFVVINNNGGGIFRRLPIAEFEPEFSALFLTPHDLDFAHAARLYGLDFVRVTDRAALREALGARMYDRRPCLIEVMSDGRYDDQRRREINKIANS